MEWDRLVSHPSTIGEIVGLAENVGATMRRQYNGNASMDQRCCHSVKLISFVLVSYI